MSTDLGDRLDELAEAAVGERTLDYPALAEQTPHGPRRAPLALAACIALLVLVLGAWWIQRTSEPTDVNTAGPIASQPIPALLLEQPTPIAELPLELRETFVANTPRGPLPLLDPELSELTFLGAHVVRREGVTVAVGLDESGRFLCIAQSIDGQEGSSSSCGAPTRLISDRNTWERTTVTGGSIAIVLVPDDVTSVSVGVRVAEVERNVAVLVGPIDDVTVLRYADGTTEPAHSFPDPSAIGEIVVDDGRQADLVSVGCSIVDDQFLVEGDFFGSGFVSATVTPAGLVLQGGFGEDGIEVVDPDAVVEPLVVDGLLSVSVSWKTDESSGTLTIDCGDRLIDLSDIR